MKKQRDYTIVIILILVCLLALTIFAMSLPDDDRHERYSVSVVVEDSSDSRWAAFRAGLDQAAEDYDITINYVSTSNNLTLSQQSSLLRNEVNDGADALITELVNSGNTESLLQDLSSKVPVELISTSAAHETSDNVGLIMADSEKIAEALASEVMVANNRNLTGKKIGMIVGNQLLSSMKDRRERIDEILTDAGGELLWQIRGTELEIASVKERLDETDIVIALDSKALDSGVDLISGTDIPLYGIGSSSKSAYALDKGEITSMIVPNGFNMGYRSIAAISAKLENPLSRMEEETITWQIVNKGNMYNGNNEMLLFPIVN